MGFHPNGRWALLTNYRDFHTQRKAEISRGKLVQCWLEASISPREYLLGIQGFGTSYEGFNLLVSDGDSIWYLSNYSTDVTEIPPGIHGLSNGLINEPWPKVQLAKSQLEDFMAGPIDENRLINTLKSTQTYPLTELPQTGVPEEMEIGLSAQLIRLGSNYGTVSAMAVIQNHKGETLLKERVYERDFQRYRDQQLTFQQDLTNNEAQNL